MSQSLQPDSCAMKVAHTVYAVFWTDSEAQSRHVDSLVVKQKWKAERAKKLAHQGESTELPMRT
jgi:hypothetical protein